MAELNQIILYSTYIMSGHSCQQQLPHTTFAFFQTSIQKRIKPFTYLQLQKNRKITEKSTEKINHSHKQTNIMSSLQINNAQIIENISHLSDFSVENIDDDSSFQFSQQIMLNNPRNQQREQRQKNKLPHLCIFDWMMKTSTTLKSVIIIKKFLFLQQKTSHSKVTMSNVNLYGLAALLIASKYQSVGGNFLNNISRLVGSGQRNSLSKECVLECEQYILRILGFRVPNKSIIIEVTLQVIYKWDQLIEKTQLEHLRLGRRGVNYSYLNQQASESVAQLIQTGKHVPNAYKNLLQIFLWLIDYDFMRRLVQLKIKQLQLMQNPDFFKKHIANILYHLFSHIIQFHQNEEGKLQMFKKYYLKIVQKLAQNDSDCKSYFRKSHLLSKQIRKIFGNENKLQKLKQINRENIKFIANYCSCRHISKYINEPFTTGSTTENINPANTSKIQIKANEMPPITIQAIIGKNKMDYDTNPNEQSQICLVKSNQTAILNGKQMNKNICKCSTSNNQAIRLLADRQFYIPLIDICRQNQQNY